MNCARTGSDEDRKHGIHRKRRIRWEKESPCRSGPRTAASVGRCRKEVDERRRQPDRPTAIYGRKSDAEAITQSNGMNSIPAHMKRIKQPPRDNGKSEKSKREARISFNSPQDALPLTTNVNTLLTVLKTTRSCAFSCSRTSLASRWELDSWTWKKAVCQFIVPSFWARGLSAGCAQGYHEISRRVWVIALLPRHLPH